MVQLCFPNVTLCAIVKDLDFNLAGDVISFVDSIVPFVKKAIITDTGSTDTTLDKLLEKAKEYSNLKVLQRDFDNFHTSRNAQLPLVDTDYVLVLDADERLDEDELNKLNSISFENYLGVAFKFYEIFQNGIRNKNGNSHRVRLFRNNWEIKYRTFNLWEYPFFQNQRLNERHPLVFPSSVYITHYLRKIGEDLEKYPKYLTA